jgi:hypothetical protein
MGMYYTGIKSANSITIAPDDYDFEMNLRVLARHFNRFIINTGYQSHFATQVFPSKHCVVSIATSGKRRVTSYDVIVNITADVFETSTEYDERIGQNVLTMEVTE